MSEAETDTMRPNKIAAHNAGWRTQFRFAGSVFWSGVCDLVRWATNRS
jgi:hypothetical protein